MYISDIIKYNRVNFKNREEAGVQLADLLSEYKNVDVEVLALPRGGVPVAFQVAKKLDAPLSVIISRKIGAPGNVEFGIGAVSEVNSLYLDEATIKSLDISSRELTQAIDKQKAELRRRVKLYRDNRKLPDLNGKIVILVDDGLATGATAIAASKALKNKKPRKIIFVSPVCAMQSIQQLEVFVDETICVITPRDMRAIGLYYKDFSQTTDDEVVELLNKFGDLNRTSN